MLDTGRVLGVSLSGAGGTVEFDAEIRGTMTATIVDRHICVLLAGRAAEELALGEISIGGGNGPASDLARATDLAARLENQYGLGSLGPVHVENGATGRLLSSPRHFDAIRKRLEEAQERATTILKTHQELLLRLADELEKRSYLSASDIEAIVGQSAPGPAAEAKDAAE